MSIGETEVLYFMYGVGLSMKIATSSTDMIMGYLGISEPVWYVETMGGK